MTRRDNKAEVQRGDRPRQAMCSDKHRALLLPYALTGCGPADGLAFEAHLLGCDACFEDLKSLDLAAALIGQPDVARVALADLFYNPLPGPALDDGVGSILASIPAPEVHRQAKKA